MNAPFAPSRHANPFATCWTRPGAIPFRFPNGMTAERLVERLRRNGWWGAIIGPHGSGKTTLLEHLKPMLQAQVPFIQSITVHAGAKCGRLAISDELQNRGLLIVDGYEQFGWFQKAGLMRRCRQLRCGLLVTAHRSTALKTLIELRPCQPLVEHLVAKITAGVPSLIAAADVAASHARNGSNVRDIFFDLYDRHEQRRRGGMNASPEPAGVVY